MENFIFCAVFMIIEKHIDILHDPDDHMKSWKNILS